MTEKHKNGDDQPEKKTESDDDIIELSDIAIGITLEDDTIVELTEDIIDEAFVGFTGATSELIEDDERVLDLSENIRAKRNEAMSQPVPEKSGKSSNEFEDRLEEKSGTLPDKPQMQQTDDAAHIASGQVDEAIERVIRKMFAEKINRILDEIIERTVTEVISQLKGYLLGIAGKKE